MGNKIIKFPFLLLNNSFSSISFPTWQCTMHHSKKHGILYKSCGTFLCDTNIQLVQRKRCHVHNSEFSISFPFTIKILHRDDDGEKKTILMYVFKWSVPLFYPASQFLVVLSGENVRDYKNWLIKILTMSIKSIIISTSLLKLDWKIGKGNAMQKIRRFFQCDTKEEEKTFQIEHDYGQSWLSELKMLWINTFKYHNYIRYIARYAGCTIKTHKMVRKAKKEKKI